MSKSGRRSIFWCLMTSCVRQGVCGSLALLLSISLTGLKVQAQITERVSVSSTGEQGNGHSLDDVSISEDGRYVAFRSTASNLVPGDTNEDWDIFVYDRVNHTTERVGISSTGEQGNRESGFRGLSVSDDGRYVAFTSLADNLVPGDANGGWDVFVRDRSSSIPTLNAPAVIPATGDTNTTFTFSIIYTHPNNQAPDYAYAVLLKPDGSRLLKALSSSDGSRYTATTKLPTIGTYSYFFQFQLVDAVVKTATYTGPGVSYQIPLLSNPSLSPTVGSTSTAFTFKVTYTQGDNLAPEYGYVALLTPDGSRLLKPMTSTETTYARGSRYTCQVKLPAGSYSYYFQFKGGGKTAKTPTYSGPTVN